MKIQFAHRTRISRISSFVLSAIFAGTIISSAVQARAQNPDLQARIAEIKQAAAANKKALSQYTWQEQETISIKGEVKKTKLYQVSVGPDGKQIKNEVGDQSAQQPSGRSHGLKHRVIEHATSEYEQYGQQIAALAKEYAKPDPDKLQQAYQQGNVSLQSGGDSGTVSLVIKNYIKPGDSVTLIFNRQQKAIQNLQVSTYLSDPSDAVTLSAQFAKLPDGTNHVASMQVNGVKKQLTISTQNSYYQKV